MGQLKAIEPSEGMRNTFSKTVKDDRVTVAEGSFDKTGINDGWADIVIIAQVRFRRVITNDLKKADYTYIRRRSIGAQITTALPQSFLASSSQKALLHLFGT